MESSTTKNPDAWLTANEAATYLKVKPRTILLWARQGKVRAYTLSGTHRHVWRFRQADLDASAIPSPADAVLSCAQPSAALGTRRVH